MIGLLGSYFSEQGSEGESGGLGDDPVSEESEFIRSIVTGDAQLGIVQPTGRPIRVSHHLGLSDPRRLPGVLLLAGAGGP